LARLVYIDERHMEKAADDDTRASGIHLLSVARGHEFVKVLNVIPDSPTITACLELPLPDSPPEGDAVERCVLLGLLDGQVWATVWTL